MVEGSTLALTRRERLVWAALASDIRIGPKSFAALRRAAPQLESIWDHSHLADLGLPAELVERIACIRRDISLDALDERLTRLGVQALTIEDAAYPALLKEIAVPPAVLFVRGELTDGPTLAVVGTRMMTPYGKRVVGDLVCELARQGLTIVSGLALGIDGAAHRAALEGKGKTWGVLASGVDHPYPATHRGLADDMLATGGALVSEFPLGTGALRHHFPIRNRIIAGLSRATLVIEAAAQSGSLITARSALEANRDVFAVPGSVYAIGSTGPHMLIGMGAKLVQTADDILHELHLVQAQSEATTRQIVPDSHEEALILAQLGADPLTIDELAVATNMDAAVVMSTVTLMEMKGRLRHLGNNCFVRR